MSEFTGGSAKRGRGRPKKDPFAIIETEWKDAIASSTPEEINKRIAQVAKDEDENIKLKKDDEDLARIREELKTASAQYTEGTKRHKAMVAFARQVLSDKGAE